MSFLERDNFTFVPSPSQATLEAAENPQDQNALSALRFPISVAWTELRNASCIINFLVLTHRKQFSASVARYPGRQARPLRDRHPDTSENHVCPSYGARAPRHGRAASWGLGLVGWTPGPGGHAGPHEPPIRVTSPKLAPFHPPR